MYAWAVLICGCLLMFDSVFGACVVFAAIFAVGGMFVANSWIGGLGQLVYVVFIEADIGYAVCLLVLCSRRNLDVLNVLSELSWAVPNSWIGTCRCSRAREEILTGRVKCMRIEIMIKVGKGSESLVCNDSSCFERVLLS